MASSWYDQYNQEQSGGIPVSQQARGYIAGDTARDAFYGPANNYLGPNQASVSPNLMKQGYGMWSWFQDSDGNWLQVADPSFKHPGQPNTNTVEFANYVHPDRGMISPPGGWSQSPSPGNITDDPFVSQSQQQQAPQISSPGNITDDPFAGGVPASVPDTYVPQQFQMPQNIPTNEQMTASGPNQYMPPTPVDIPTYEGMNVTPQNQYFADNPPTNESMLPTGPADYQQSTPANVPTNEFMQPTGPNDYALGTGANVPTNEAMTPTDPGLYQQPLLDQAAATSPGPQAGGFAGDTTGGAAPAAPTDSGATPTGLSFYPDGQGNYVMVDAMGNTVGTMPTGGDSGPNVGNQTGGFTGLGVLGSSNLLGLGGGGGGSIAGMNLNIGSNFATPADYNWMFGNLPPGLQHNIPTYQQWAGSFNNLQGSTAGQSTSSGRVAGSVQ